MYSPSSTTSNSYQHWLLQQYDGSRNWYPHSTENMLNTVPSAGYLNPSIRGVGIARHSLQYRSPLNDASSKPSALSLTSPMDVYAELPPPSLNYHYRGSGTSNSAYGQRNVPPASLDLGSNRANINMRSSDHIPGQQREMPRPTQHVHSQSYPYSHAHAPHRSSRLNPNTTGYYRSAQHIRPLAHNHPSSSSSSSSQTNAAASYSQRVPFGALTATLSSNASLSGYLSAQLPTTSDALFHSTLAQYFPQITQTRIQPTQILNRENLDPSSSTEDAKQIRIEAPIPVRYHDIAVESLQTHASNMNNDVGFLSLLNGIVAPKARLGVDSSLGEKDVETSKDKTNQDVVAEKTDVHEDSNTAEGVPGAMEVAKQATGEDAKQKLNVDEAIPEGTNEILKARLKSYGPELRLASPETLIAMTEPILLDWCYDEEAMKRLAAMDPV